jgi:DNA-binding SARP family transcriptional activator
MLGPFEVRGVNGQRICVHRRKQRALLALLVVRAGRPAGVRELVDALWGQQPPASARANLHSYVCGVRRLLAGRAAEGGPQLMTTPSGYRLHFRAEDSDAAVFEGLATQGRRAVADGRAEEAAEVLTRALGMWQGRVLQDLESYDWSQPVASRLEELRLRVVEDRARARLLLRQHADAAVDLAEVTAVHPLRETLWHHYLLALYQADRRTDALLAYRKLCAALDDELGVKPTAALQSLYHRMREGERARPDVPLRPTPRR